MTLDSMIEGTDITCRERIELLAGDARGGAVGAESELSAIEGGKEYASERTGFWAEWNRAWRKEHGQKGMNTQRRYIEAQRASPVYASAVYKTLVSLIASQILRDAREFQEALFKNTAYALQEYLWDFMGGSLLMMRRPSAACFSSGFSFMVKKGLLNFRWTSEKIFLALCKAGLDGVEVELRRRQGEYFFYIYVPSGCAALAGDMAPELSCHGHICTCAGAGSGEDEL